tara:strand:- start:462 stop:1064 length:603 start_codon:yes stop_codon:yes gene_type:complete
VPFEVGKLTMKKVLVIDSHPDSKHVDKISFTMTPPKRKYIEHSNDVLSIFEKVMPEAELVFAHITCEYEDDKYYGSLFNHQNFNKALEWAKDKGFSAIYAQAQFYCPPKYAGIDEITNRYAKEHRKTERILKTLKIPIVCPAENTAEERIWGVLFSPKLSSAEYVSSSTGPKFPGTVVVKSKDYEYTSQLAVLRVCELLS